MALALDVARFLIHLATPGDDEDADFLSHLRLQKLMYYVQAWHAAACNRPLFAGRIEAWTHGPVVRDLYPVFKDYRHAITPDQGDVPDSLTERDMEFVRWVWEEYQGYSATALRNMTHAETPWLDARGDLPPAGRCENEITVESMRAFFRPRLREKLAKSNPGIKLASWDKATAAIEAGQVQTTEEIRRELRRRRAGADPG
jgi:uncharacterized phage-associated protein